MEFVGLLLGALLALLVLLTLSRGAPRRAAPREPADLRRVTRLCRHLTGDPIRDRPLLNRILALGPDVVPTLIAELTECHRHPDRRSPTRAARLEEVVADFGLAAVPAVTDALARLHPTAPLVPGLVRILRRLRGPGARAVIDRAVRVPDLAPFLPRFRFDGPGHDPVGALVAALRRADAEQRALALELCAGLLSPAAIESLWAAWGAEGRADLLRWLTDWLPIAERAGLAERGLRDRDPAVRVAAARLATILPSSVGIAALTTAVEDDDPGVRAAVCRAIAARRASTRALLDERLRDADPRVALEALLGRLRDPERPPPDLPGPIGLLLDDERPVDAALAGLEDPAPALRRAAAHLLGRRHADPRARERLIRLAEAPDPRDRATAVLVLARAGDAVAGDLVIRVVRAGALAGAELLDVQEAAQRVGPAVAAPLARRLRSRTAGRVDATLAVLRAVPYAEAVPPLLRGVEDARSGALEGRLAATLHVGGAEVRAVIGQALRQPTRGLLAPALRFLAAYGEPADLPLLVELFDRHPPLRGVLLNLIEGQGAAAIEPLRARIDAGGEDAVVESLEQRLAMLEAVYEDG